MLPDEVIDGGYGACQIRTSHVAIDSGPEVASIGGRAAVVGLEDRIPLSHKILLISMEIISIELPADDLGIAGPVDLNQGGLPGVGGAGLEEAGRDRGAFRI